MHERIFVFTSWNSSVLLWVEFIWFRLFSFSSTILVVKHWLWPIFVTVETFLLTMATDITERFILVIYRLIKPIISKIAISIRAGSLILFYGFYKSAKTPFFWKQYYECLIIHYFHFFSLFHKANFNADRNCN